MPVDNIIILSMAAFIVAQQIFWSFQVHKLIDKNMCRDLSEYRYSAQSAQTVKLPAEEDKEEWEVLAELNGAIGVR